MSTYGASGTMNMHRFAARQGRLTLPRHKKKTGPIWEMQGCQKKSAYIKDITAIILDIFTVVLESATDPPAMLQATTTSH